MPTGRVPGPRPPRRRLVPPPAPAKPAVGPLDRAVQVTLPAAGDPTSCPAITTSARADGGATWVADADTTTSDGTTAQVADLTNGTGYVCRAFAEGAAGRSDASPMSDAVTPCGSSFECTPILAPIAGVLGILLLVGLGLLVFAFLRSRQRGYVVAVVDVVHTANLGYGSKLGIRFVKDPTTRRLTGVVADRGPEADIKIRHLGRGRFEVTDRMGRRTATRASRSSPRTRSAVRHELVLRAFDTNAASQVTSQV